MRASGHIQRDRKREVVSNQVSLSIKGLFVVSLGALDSCICSNVALVEFFVMPMIFHSSVCEDEELCADGMPNGL